MTMAKRGRPRKFQSEGEKSARSIPTKTVENLADQPEKSNIKEYSLDDFISEKIEKSSQEIQEQGVILTIPEIISQENSENQGINITENQINIEKIDNQTSFVFSILNYFFSKNNIDILDDTERQELLFALMQFEFFRVIILRYMKYLVITKVLGIRIIKLFFKKSENTEEKNQ
jgi:hypothetical protein